MQNFNSRIGAFLLDILLVNVATFLIFFVSIFLSSPVGGGSVAAGAIVDIFIVTGAIGFVLGLLIQGVSILKHGSSVGKKILKLKVIRSDNTERLGIFKLLIIRPFLPVFLPVIVFFGASYLKDSISIQRSSFLERSSIGFLNDYKNIVDDSWRWRQEQDPVLRRKLYFEYLYAQDQAIERRNSWIKNNEPKYFRLADVELESYIVLSFILILIDSIFAFFNREQRCIHDLLAGTKVIKMK